jgi:hypothetical protein
MYAQQIEGESWVGEKIDQGKLQKLSGKPFLILPDLLPPSPPPS